MALTLWVVRHAPVVDRGLCYGRSEAETSMSPGEAAARLHLPPIDRLWSSPSRRCHDLASFLAGREARPLTVDERLHELSLGRWEGRRWDDLPGSELAAWGDSWQASSPPGGETIADLGARVGAWQSELSAGERHLLVAHAGVVRALWVLCEGRTWTEAMAAKVPFLEPITIEAKESL